MECPVAHVTSAPVSGLFVLGTRGEEPSLDYRTRKDVAHIASRLKSAETPLLVSVTDTSLVEMQTFADFAAAEGADDLGIAPPYYLPPGDPEILRWHDFFEANLPLPYFVYHMPGMTKVDIRLRAVSQILKFSTAGIQRRLSCFDLSEKSVESHQSPK